MLPSDQNNKSKANITIALATIICHFGTLSLLLQFLKAMFLQHILNKKVAEKFGWLVRMYYFCIVDGAIETTQEALAGANETSDQKE